MKQVVGCAVFLKNYNHILNPVLLVRILGARNNCASEISTMIAAVGFKLPPGRCGSVSHD